MRSIFKTNQSGIALLLVIASIVVLTMLAVEFAYNGQVEYHLALKQKERLQAYYLAQSAYQLTLLELKMGGAVQSQVAQATQGMNLPVDLSAPLCEQFPMKTSLFRMVMAGEGGDGEKEEKTKEKKSDEAPPKEEAIPKGLPEGLSLSGLEEFLKFEGDFEAECKDEGSKIDLNYFYTQNPETKAPEGQDNPYDAYKKFIIQFLSQPQFEELFRDKDVRIPEVVRNIADFIDPNEAINEMGGGQGGSEESIYRGVSANSWKVKNGKLSTPEEIYEVEGVQDSWWPAVADYFTIYGMTDERGNPQINVCRAPNEVVQGLILRYVETRKDLPPFPPNPAEIMSQLVKAVKGGCTGARPDKNKIAQDLDAKLLELLKVAPVGETPPPAGGGTAGTGTAGAGTAGAGTAGYAPASSAFADWISTQTRFYQLKLIGQVKDTMVRIQAVIDLGTQGGGDPRQWKLVYWKVE